jgi:hypothetical protein
VADFQQAARGRKPAEQESPMVLLYSGRSFSTVRPLVHATLSRHYRSGQLPRQSQIPQQVDRESFAGELVEWCCAHTRPGSILIIGDEMTPHVIELADVIASDPNGDRAISAVNVLVASTTPLLFPESRHASVFLVPCSSVHSAWGDLAGVVTAFSLVKPSRLSTTYEFALSAIRATRGRSYIIGYCDLMGLPELEVCTRNIFASELLESTFKDHPSDCFAGALNQVEAEMRRAGAFNTDPPEGTFHSALKRETCRLAIVDVASLVVQGMPSVEVFCKRLADLTRNLDSRICAELCEDLMREARCFRDDIVQSAEHLLNYSSIDLASARRVAADQAERVVASQRFPLLSYLPTFNTMGRKADLVQHLERGFSLVQKAIVDEVDRLKRARYQNAALSANPWPIETEPLDVLSLLPLEFSRDTRDELWNVNKLSTVKIYRKVG